jgi:hypothetical protein
MEENKEILLKAISTKEIGLKQSRKLKYMGTYKGEKDI